MVIKKFLRKMGEKITYHFNQLGKLETHLDSETVGAVANRANEAVVC